ncbi:MAG: Cna B-type domain-containing protein [Ruminococcus sp.]|nr:Cna B-type domain-containing protein [Ruminococcus sp.]
MLLKKYKIFNIVICIMTVVSFFSLIIPPQKSHADSNDKSLTLVCVSGDVILEGMQWKLYKVGERSDTEQAFIKTGEFAGFQINMRNLAVENVNEMAQSFQSYAIANQIVPVGQGETDQNGEIEFSGLDAGLYLIAGKLLKTDSYYYVPATALVELREDDTNIRYNTYPEFTYQVMSAESRSYTVMKKWLNDENMIDRPTEITVDIYKDEELYDTVFLNDSNGWKYRWTDDEGTSSWLVMERDIPVHYEMKITYDELRYIIENTYFEDAGIITYDTDTEVEDDTETTTTVSGSADDGSTTSTDTTTTVSSSLAKGSATITGKATTVSSTVGNGSATKTGTGSSLQSNGNTTTAPSDINNDGESGGKLQRNKQLWWVVILVSAGGVVLVAVGTIRARKKSDK